jgi:hypothetical protein
MLQLVLTVSAATAAMSQGSFEIRGYVPPKCYSGSTTISSDGELKSQGTSCTISAVSEIKTASGETQALRVTVTPR